MLVTTLTVDGGVVVVTLVELTVVKTVVSFDVEEMLLDFDAVVDGVVVNVDDGCCVVVAVVFGSNESTTPTGPVKSTSLSGHINSSG